MRKIFFIASCSSVLLGLLACEDAMRWGALSETDDLGREGRAEAALVKAREAEAERYAPALYGAAVEALEQGEAGDETTAAMEERSSAEALARRALDEAIRVREEAKQAAGLGIRDASVLLSVVEAILRHDPPNRERLPSEARLAELRTELSRALEAYQAGDYAAAGHVAQSVAAELRES